MMRRNSMRKIATTRLSLLQLQELTITGNMWRRPLILMEISIRKRLLRMAQVSLQLPSCHLGHSAQGANHQILEAPTIYLVQCSTKWAESWVWWALPSINHLRSLAMIMLWYRQVAFYHIHNQKKKPILGSLKKKKKQAVLNPGNRKVFLNRMLPQPKASLRIRTKRQSLS